mgnify:CR=1 FL=1
MMACIRNMYEREYPLLKDFLYEAIYIPEGVTPPPKSVVEIPELQVYIADFGKQKHDKAMVAEVEGKVIGAVWARIMQDYGHIDDDTPSLSISLYKQYRGQGIGTALLTKMLYGLKEAGYKQASLSVQKANDAVRLYQRLGFETVGENTEEYIMKKQL